MPAFSDKLHLMVNVSMDLEVNDSGDTDAVLSKQITEFAERCPQLRTLTIHLLSYDWRIPDFSADSATASVIRQLRPRLDNISILVLGSRPHKVLPELRLSIADNKYWSGNCWSGEFWSDQCWSGERSSGFKAPLQWPCLTLPSLIQGHGARECSKSMNFISPPHDDDYIYKWTCRNEVEEDVGLNSLPLSAGLEFEEQQ